MWFVDVIIAFSGLIVWVQVLLFSLRWLYECLDMFQPFQRASLLGSYGATYYNELIVSITQICCCRMACLSDCLPIGSPVWGNVCMIFSSIASFSQNCWNYTLNTSRFSVWVLCVLFLLVITPVAPLQARSLAFRCTVSSMPDFRHRRLRPRAQRALPPASCTNVQSIEATIWHSIYFRRHCERLQSLLQYLVNAHTLETPPFKPERMKPWVPVCNAYSALLLPHLLSFIIGRLNRCLRNRRSWTDMRPCQ